MTMTRSSLSSPFPKTSPFAPTYTSPYYYFSSSSSSSSRKRPIEDVEDVDDESDSPKWGIHARRYFDLTQEDQLQEATSKADEAIAGTQALAKVVLQPKLSVVQTVGGLFAFLFPPRQQGYCPNNKGHLRSNHLVPPGQKQGDGGLRGCGVDKLEVFQGTPVSRGRKGGWHLLHLLFTIEKRPCGHDNVSGHHPLVRLLQIAKGEVWSLQDILDDLLDLGGFGKGTQQDHLVDSRVAGLSQEPLEQVLDQTKVRLVELLVFCP